MKRIIGYTLFCIAIGMVIAFFLVEHAVISVLTIFILLLAGYNLFCC